MCVLHAPALYFMRLAPRKKGICMDANDFFIKQINERHSNNGNKKESQIPLPWRTLIISLLQVLLHVSTAPF